MVQLFTLVIGLAAALASWLAHPAWGWAAIGLLDLYFALTCRAAVRANRLPPSEQISPEANALMQRYGHYFASPFACRDFSASAATSQFIGLVCAVIGGVAASWWWGLALAAVNFVAMGAIATRLSPAAPMASDPAVRLAHDEVVAFLHGTHSPQ